MSTLVPVVHFLVSCSDRRGNHKNLGKFWCVHACKAIRLAHGLVWEDRYSSNGMFSWHQVKIFSGLLNRECWILMPQCKTICTSMWGCHPVHSLHILTKGCFPGSTWESMSQRLCWDMAWAWNQNQICAWVFAMRHTFQCCEGHQKVGKWHISPLSVQHAQILVPYMQAVPSLHEHFMHYSMPPVRWCEYLPTIFTLGWPQFNSLKTKQRFIGSSLLWKVIMLHISWIKPCAGFLRSSSVKKELHKSHVIVKKLALSHVKSDVQPDHSLTIYSWKCGVNVKFWCFFTITSLLPKSFFIEVPPCMAPMLWRIQG